MRRVLELPAFRRLLLATVLNEIAIAIGAVGLALLVYRNTGSAVGAAVFFLCAEFGPALLSPALVARLDQRSLRRALASLYALEGAVFFILAWTVGRFTLIPVLALALISGTLAVAGRVLTRAAWTELTMPAGLLREAGAVVGVLLSLCYMVGPALGGGLVALWGTRSALLIDGGLLAVITMTIATAPSLPTAVPDPSAATGRLRRAFARAAEEPLMRRLLGLQAVGLVFFTISIPVEVVFAQQTLHAGASGYGVLLAVWGGGGIIGSAAYARWRGQSSRALMTLGAGLLGLGFLWLALAPSLGVGLIGAAIGGVGNCIEFVAFRTTLQEECPPRWRALILSLNESMIQAVPGIGIVLGGAIAATAGSRVALGVCAAGTIAVAIAMWAKLPSSPAENTAPVPSTLPETREPDATIAVPRP